MDPREFIIQNGERLTISELIESTGLKYNQVYVVCKNHGIRPKDSTWCTRTVQGLKPEDRIIPQKKKIERAPAEYSNTTPFGIAKSKH